MLSDQSVIIPGCILITTDLFMMYTLQIMIPAAQHSDPACGNRYGT